LVIDIIRYVFCAGQVAHKLRQLKRMEVKEMEQYAKDQKNQETNNNISQIRHLKGRK